MATPTSIRPNCSPLPPGRGGRGRGGRWPPRATSMGRRRRRRAPVLLPGQTLRASPETALWGGALPRAARTGSPLTSVSSSRSSPAAPAPYGCCPRVGRCRPMARATPSGGGFQALAVTATRGRGLCRTTRSQAGGYRFRSVRRRQPLGWWPLLAGSPGWMAPPRPAGTRCGGRGANRL